MTDTDAKKLVKTMRSIKKHIVNSNNKQTLTNRNDLLISYLSILLLLEEED